MANIFQKLREKFPTVKREVLLKNYTTFKIGGPAEYFFVAKKNEEVIKSIRVARKLKIPVFVLGGGSNLLVSDNGIEGLVVKIENKKPIKLKSKNVIEAPAGISMGEVVDFSIKKSLKGLEWAGGLPGTLGGAIRGNAGAFGGEIKDSIFQVQVLDQKYNLRKLSNRQCNFSYRNSIFKEENWVVLSVSLKLEKGDKKELRKIADSRINYRKERHPLEYPNAGSIFNNVALKDLSPKFKKEFSDKVKQDPFPVVPTAWFIIGAGLVGKKIGQAQVSTKHSNYIVNLGGAKAKDVLGLVDFIRQKVKEKYNLNLEVEVQFVGE